MAEKNEHGVQVKVLGKAEFMNPGLSHKDRIITNIIDKAEKAGKIAPNMGNTLLAASSGNTGASLAMVGAMRGYKVVVITNAKCSTEKQDAIKMYGAKLLLAPAGKCYMQMELDLGKENPSWFMVNQYDNLDNPEAHYLTTGPEIYQQTNGTVTHFVMGASTGGTISGVGKYLKE
jgi:cystathionine beta-synthase